MRAELREAYARIIVEHALAVEPGHSVLVETQAAGRPLALELHRRILVAGGHPLVRVLPDDWQESRVECAPAALLEQPDAFRSRVYDVVDRRVNVIAEANTRSTEHLPAERIAAEARGRSRGMAPLLDRAAAGSVRWCAAQYPTEAAAQEAGMSLDDYTALLARGLMLDCPDPVAAWREAATEQERIVRFLSGVDELRVVATGTDLRLRVGGRAWLSAAGAFNLPDGEVYTGPVEDATEGTIRFTVPARGDAGVVEDFWLRFERGRVVEHGAASGEEVLRAALDSDRGARVLGEFAIGLNYGIDRPTFDSLLDEKIGGTIHVALGHSYAETGGVNESDLHWDLVCDLREGGELYADGELFYRDGRFLPELDLR